jgi:hypothetical protein
MTTRKMSDNEVVEMIKAKIPEWADGAVVAPLGLEFLPSVRPVKKSKYYDGFWTSKRWKPIDGDGMTVHETDYNEVLAFYREYRERGAKGVVVTRDGKLIKVTKVTEGKDLNFNIYVGE